MIMSDKFSKELRIASNFGFLIGSLLIPTASFLDFNFLAGMLLLNRLLHFLIFNRLF